jgi:PGF-pre-PGF domain-containing protein
LANNLYLPNVILPIIGSGDDSSITFTSPAIVIQTEIVNVGGGSAVARANMTGTGLGKNLVITAMPLSSLPSTIAPPLTIVYQYLSITSSTITGAVSKITFDFSVPQSWLTEQGFTTGDIVMMHYVDGQWKTLETQFVSEKSGNVYYRATTTGLSYFAIAYQKDGTNMGTSIPVPTTMVTKGASVTDAPIPVSVISKETQNVTPSMVTPPVKGTPLTIIIIGIIGAIAFIISAFFVWRWWIRRQNPALFRDYE